MWGKRTKAAVVVVAMFEALVGALPSARAEIFPLGTRWAVERDERGKVAAIDDLSYAGLTGRVVVGHILSLDGGDFEARALEAMKRVYPGMLVPEQHMRPGGLEGKWWQAVPWKRGSLMASRSDVEPESFGMEDIDFSRATRDRRRFASLVDRLSTSVAPGFFESFRFVRTQDGGYDIQWVPKVPLPLSGPLRVVQGPIRYNLWLSIRHQLRETAVGETISLITVPVLADLAGTALDRFLHWYDLLVSTRQEALGEMLADPPADFNLTPAERQAAGQSLLFAQISLLYLPTWIWERSAKEWAKRLAGETNNGIVSREWLAKAGVPVDSLSRDFDWNPNLGQIYVSGAGIPWSAPNSGPPLGWDASNPNRIPARRIAVEIAVTAADFASNWIPYIGGLENDGFKDLVQGPEDSMRCWETRLAVRLEERESSLGEDWEPVLTGLARQQQNPLELSRAQMQELIAERRQGMAVAPLIAR